MLKPFVKWVGGKKQLLDELTKIVNENFKNYETYIEPFVGGGALLFKLSPPSFIINDQNSELINLYKVVKENPQELLNSLRMYEKNNSQDYYYNVRQLDREAFYKLRSSVSLKEKVEQSARFIYLNKTSFNGMYRVNSNGYFNVPFGNYKNPNIVNENNILIVSKFLNSSKNKILNADFEFVLKFAKKNDLVYFDPPYIPLENTKSFTSYTSNGFTLEDQIRLRDCALKLINKKVNVILSNSYTEKTFEIYDLLSLNSKFNYLVVNVNRSINSNGKKRTGAKEIIIWNKKEES